MKRIFLTLMIIFASGAIASFMFTLKAYEDEVNNPVVEASVYNGSFFNDSQNRLNFDGMNFCENIEELDYIHLAGVEYLTIIMGWLTELGFETEDVDWVESNFNKIIRKAILEEIVPNFICFSYIMNSDCSIPLISLTSTEPEIVQTRWARRTHRSATDIVFSLLKEDGNFELIYDFFSSKIVTVNYSYNPIAGGSIHFFNQTIPADRALHFLSAQPDFVEHIAGTHYYIVDENNKSTIGNYYKNANGNFSRSARTRVEDHYSTALNAWANGDFNNAINYLGFALHYLMDIGNTAHSAGIRDEVGTFFLKFITAGIILLPHSAYEAYAAAECWRGCCYEVDELGDIKAKSNFFHHRTGANITARFGEFAEGFGDAINNMAHISSSFKNNIAGITVFHDKPTAYDPVLAATVPLTLEYVAALLDQFITDVRAIDGLTAPTFRSEKVIICGERYFLRNYMTGLYMDCKGWGSTTGTAIQQFNFRGDTNQMFFAIYRGDGSFSFRPANSQNTRVSFDFGFLNLNTYGIAQLRNYTPNSRYQRFRFTILEDGKYRVMTGASDYARVLRVHASNPGSNVNYIRQVLSEFAFNPDSMNHYWRFEKVIDLPGAQSVFAEDFEGDKVYVYRPAASGNRTFTATSHTRNIFSINRLMGSGSNSTTMQVAQSGVVQAFTVNLAAASNIQYFIKIHRLDDDELVWEQPVFTSNSNSHGTVTASNFFPGEEPFGAFDGFIGNLVDGRNQGFPAVQWTTAMNRPSGWIELKLNYQIRVYRIEFYNRWSGGNARTRDAMFTGTNGIRLGNEFRGINSNFGLSVIHVDYILTDIIRLNVFNSHGSAHVGANEIRIFATRVS